jgi:hypothetical protein
MFLNNEFLGLYEELSELNEAKADTLRLVDFAGEDLANRFLAVKNRLKAPENDLYYWIKNKTPEDLELAISNLENTKTKTQAKKDLAEAGAELISETEHWSVYHITTFEAAQKYGRDTKWCITGIDGYGDKYWKEYTEDAGVNFYFLITTGKYDSRGTGSKFALALYPRGLGEVFNQQDEKVSFKDIPYIDEVHIPGYDLNSIKEPTITTDYEITVYSGSTRRSAKVAKHTSGMNVPMDQALTEITDWISELTLDEKNLLSLSWSVHNDETVIVSAYAPHEGTIERVLNNTDDATFNAIEQALELNNRRSNSAECDKCGQWVFTNKLRSYDYDFVCPECYANAWR